MNRRFPCPEATEPLWIQTRSGLAFDLPVFGEVPNASQVRTDDLIDALCDHPRFTGHTLRPYSVGEHTLRGLDIIRDYRFTTTSAQRAEQRCHIRRRPLHLLPPPGPRLAPPRCPRDRDQRPVQSPFASGCDSLAAAFRAHDLNDTTK